LIWGLLRNQVRERERLSKIHELQDESRIEISGRIPAATTGWLPMDTAQVERNYGDFFRALDFQIKTNGVLLEEVALVESFHVLGLGVDTDFDPNLLPTSIREGVEVGFQRAMRLLESSKPQLGQELDNGWTQVLDKGRHGLNYVARAIMNHVGLGANVVDENTSFNTYYDCRGERLNGAHKNYILELEPPPVDFFWSVTLYDAETGHLCQNELERYSISGHSGTVYERQPVTISIQSSAPTDKKRWLPAPERPFFLVLRAYGPRQPLLRDEWQPAGVLPIPREVM